MNAFTAVDADTALPYLTALVCACCVYSMLVLLTTPSPSWPRWPRVFPSLSSPVQRVQTDRGGEFIGDAFQNELRSRHVKFRPNRPRAPHLNGKVERSQQTDRVEFWATVDRNLPAEVLSTELQTWESHYNDARSHSSLGGTTPRRRYEQLAETVPTAEAVRASYDPSKERRHSNYHYGWVYTVPPKNKPSS